MKNDPTRIHIYSVHHVDDVLDAIRAATDLSEPQRRRRVARGRVVSTAKKLRLAKRRRDRNRRRKRCVNENAAKTHGRATHGCRCKRCDAQHRRSR